MQLTGDVQLMRRFKELPAKLQKKHGRRGVAKAARIVVKAAKANAPKRSGQLKKSLGYRPKTYKSGVFAIVGPRKGFRININGKPHDPAKIAHLVEMGHGGPHAAPEKPFLRPAMDSTRGQQMAVIGEAMRVGIEAEAKI